MKNIFLEYIRIRNFKGVSDKSFTFSGFVTEICGANATGKTTVYDAFWWLLFDKNSAGDSKFLIRTLDESGNPIHNTEITVEAKLNIDGTEVELSKTQKENWVKKRGEATAELKGSNNSFMINGAPKKAGEFAEYISSIISETDFKFLTNVDFFNNLKTEDKRKYLLRLAGDITDEQLLSENPEKWEPVKDDILSIGEEDSKAKAKKTLQMLNARQKEIPVRIDELSMQTSDVPRMNYDDELNDLTVKLADLTSERDSLIPDTSEQETRLNALQGELSSLRAKHETDIADGKRELVNSHNVTEHELRSINYEMSSVRDKIAFDTNSLKTYNIRIKDLSRQYKEAKDRALDENSKVCKSCGQMLPAGRVELLVMDFDKRKQADMKAISDQGNAVKTQIDKINAEMVKGNQKLAELAKRQEEVSAKLAELDKKLAEYDSRVIPFAQTHDYTRIVNEMTQIRNDVEEAEKSSEDAVKAVETEIAKIHMDMSEIHRKQTEAEAIQKANVSINARIAELEEEQVNVGQQIAFTEQKLMLLEDFSVMKSNRLTESVNKKFELARFELFERQINGGIRPICEMSYGGVRYGSLNTGHRITVGLDVIKTFQKHFGIKAPIFIDNAECLSSDNQPHMDCQMIMLKVTDDSELKVVA